MDTGNAIEQFEEKLIRHCAPVLAGIKPASMFSCTLKCSHCCGNPNCTSFKPMDFMLAFESCRARLLAFGLEAVVLAQREKSVLMLVYRRYDLSAALRDDNVTKFLSPLGYDTTELSQCVSRLSQRIYLADLSAEEPKQHVFPHEVGLFLGYPLADVVGFIENEGSNYVTCGHWKAYSSKQEALKCFESLRACTERLLTRYAAGERLEDLVSISAQQLMNVA